MSQAETEQRAFDRRRFLRALAGVALGGIATATTGANREARPLIAGDDGEATARPPASPTIAAGVASPSVKINAAPASPALRTLSGHTDRVLGVAFSPDGQLIASVSFDKTIQLWNVADGASVRVLKGHTDRVDGVAFSPDGALLASASTDKTVRIWNVGDGAAVQMILLAKSGWVLIGCSPQPSPLSKGGRHAPPTSYWSCPGRDRPHRPCGVPERASLSPSRG